MVNTVRTNSAIIALLPNNTTGDISEQDMRDFCVSAYAWAGGLQSIKDGTALKGDGSTDDSAAMTTLFEAGGTFRVPVGTYRVPALDTVAIANDLNLYGDNPTNTIITKATNGNTDTLLNVADNIIFDRIRFEDGGVWLDFNGLATTITAVKISNCHFDNVSRATSWGELTPNANGRISRFDFLFNTAKNCDRVVFHSGAGAENAFIIGNYIDTTDRGGINLSPEQSTGQSTGRSDNHIYMGNMVRNYGFSGTNSNGFKGAGRYQTWVGNIVHTATDADTEDYEAFYSKTIGMIMSACISVNGSGSQSGGGCFSLKGGGREAQGTGQPYSYLNIINGCIGLRNSDDTHTGVLVVWVQTEDCIISNNLFDNFGGQALHVNKGAPNGYGNIGIYHNHWTTVSGGINIEGPNRGLRVIGNLFEHDSTGGSHFVTIDPQSEGVATNIMIQNNYTRVLAEKASTWVSVRFEATGASDDINTALISGNLFDATLGGTNCRGILFEGAGDIVAPIFIHGNIFKGVTDATRVIYNTTTGANATIRIGENPGFDNWTKGSATITNGTNNVAVTHNLSAAVGFVVTPDEHAIKITPTNGLHTAHCWAVSAVSSTTFTVTTYNNAQVATNVGADFTFDWEIYKREWTFS